MFLKIVKENFLQIKKVSGKLFWVNLILLAFYFLFFLCFSFFRFSEILASILKVLYFFVVSFFAVPVLLFVNAEAETSVGFLPTIKKVWARAFFYAVFMSTLSVGLVWLLRFFVKKKQDFLTGLAFSCLVLVGVLFAYLPAVLAFEPFQKGDSFFSAVKRSVLYFLQNPLITFLLFLMQLGFQALAVFSLFVLPTWFLPQIFFTKVIKFLPVVKN